jgi:taurine transport system permease protein
MTIFLIYAAAFVLAYVGWAQSAKFFTRKNEFTSRKTVTFGDESAVTANRAASVISVVVIFLIWGAFTGSVITPLHVPGPFMGETSFTYEAVNGAGQRDSATVKVLVHKIGEQPEKPAIDAATDTGFARDDAATMGAWRTKIIGVQRNDEGYKQDGFRIISIDGQPIAPGETVAVADGNLRMTGKGSLSFEPAKGWQMEPIWLPAPEAVVKRLIEISRDGYQNNTLAENVGYSLFRVLLGFFFGSLVGIPLGFAMGLSSWVRGWFDPIVEFMRPVPPLALIPLVIIWFGIQEEAKIILLFLAALWIMTIAARAGVSGVNISKVHAAYSLGASKRQILTQVIFPNALPEIFTGARVAMGVCWGTVVAAELVAAEKGAGQMIMVASKFQLTDIVIMGIMLIGVIGYSIDILMRRIEAYLVPWRGQG